MAKLKEGAKKVVEVGKDLYKRADEARTFGKVKVTAGLVGDDGFGVGFGGQFYVNSTKGQFTVLSDGENYQVKVTLSP